jgi:ankyrin repeat protein
MTLCLLACAALWSSNAAYRQEILNRRLLDACRELQVDEVQRLLDAGADANARMPYGPPRSSLEQLFALFRSGKIREPVLGDPPLVVALNSIASGRYTEVDPVSMLTILIRQGADPNTHGRYGMTPLMWVAAMDRPALAKLLIEHGADINAKNDDGRTVLSYADDDELGDTELEKLLKQLGAS